jgi:hypothetical protein
MPDLSGIETVEVDLDRTGSYDFTFDDIHSDTDVETSLYDNEEDVRGDTYFTGASVDATIVLPDLEDSSGTDQTSVLITEMTEGDYHRVRLTKYNGATIVVDKTLIKVSQTTDSNVGNLDAWELMVRDVDTSGMFYWA